MAGKATEIAIKTAIPIPKIPRFFPPDFSSSKGPNTRSNKGVNLALNPEVGCSPVECSPFLGALSFIQIRANQGVTINAIANDKSIPMLALIGIGLI